MKLVKIMSIVVFLILAAYLFYPDIQNRADARKKEILQNEKNDVSILLLEKEYQARNISASKEETEKYKTNLINALGSKEALMLALKNSDINEKNLDVLISQQIKQDKLLKELGLKEIKDSQAEKFYKENKKLFDVKERYQIYQLYIKKDNLSLLNEVKNKVNTFNFVQMAKKYSQDEEFASVGGNLGYVDISFLPDELREEISKQKVETVSLPIKTKKGYYFIYLKDKTAPKKLTFDEAKEDIKQYLYQKEKKELLQKFLEGLKAKKTINSNNQNSSFKGAINRFHQLIGVELYDNE